MLLSCAQALGERDFFALVRRAASSPEVALWAVTAVAVLHDGRTPHCLPELFAAAFATDPLAAPRLAATACGALHAFRLFVRQHDGTRALIRCHSIRARQFAHLRRRPDGARGGALLRPFAARCGHGGCTSALAVGGTVRRGDGGRPACHCATGRQVSFVDGNCNFCVFCSAHLARSGRSRL